MQEQEFELPKEPKMFLFLGKPKVGKSHCMRSLLYAYFKCKYFRFGIAFVPTKFNNEWNCLPDKYVRDDYSDDNLDKWVKHLRKMREEKGKEGMPRNFIVLD